MRRTRKVWAILLSILMVTMLLPWSTLAVFAEGEQMYAVFNESEGTLYFVRGVLDGSNTVIRTEDGEPYTGSVYSGVETKLNLDEYNFVPYEQRHTAERVVILDAFAPQSARALFSRYENVRSIEGIGLLDTSGVTDMNNMFNGLTSLEALDVTGFDTSNVTDMSYMFAGCRTLTELDVTGFNTSNVTNMSGMFFQCDSLSSLDVTAFDTMNVTDMSYMFNQCYGLTVLDVTGFDTSNVTNMEGMFGNCSGLTELDVTHFDTSNVTNMCAMFIRCSALTALDVTHFDTSNVTNMYTMFGGCLALTGLDVTHFDTSNVTNMAAMFYECGALSSLDVTHFDTSNVTDMSYMFRECDDLTELDVTSFNTSNVTNMAGMFYQCYVLPKLDVTRFDTSNVTNMSEMFYSCFSLTELDVSGFETGNVTNMARMFLSCQNLETLDVTNFDTHNVEDMGVLFGLCCSLKEIDVTGFDTSKVSNFREMFLACFSLTSIDVSGFDLHNVYCVEHTNHEGVTRMFEACHGLTDLKLGDAFEYLPNTVSFNRLFAECNSLATLDLSRFDTTNCINMENMLLNCSSLQAITLAEGFRFDGTGAALPEAPQNNGYTGKWVRLDPVSSEPQPLTACTAAWLMENYDGSADMAGTWVWQTAQPRTGAFAVLRRYDPEQNGRSSLYFIHGTMTGDVLIRTATGEPFAYDTVWWGGTPEDPGFMQVGYVPADWETGEARTSVQKAFILDELAPESTAYWFNYASYMTEIVGLDKIDTRDVRSMERMFGSCYNLTALDLTAFDTRNVTNFYAMFSGCSSISALDLSSFTITENAFEGEMLASLYSASSITFGEDFRFNGGAAAGLMEAPNNLYTCGKWVRLDPVTGEPDPSTSTTARALMESFDAASMAGTWVWQKTAPKTGSFVYYRTNDPAHDGASTMTYINGSYADGVLTRAATGETVEYDGVMYGGDDTVYGFLNGIDTKGIGGREEYIQYPWSIYNVKEVYFLDEIAPVSTANWYREGYSLTKIDGFEKLDTSNVTSMQLMFGNCNYLETVDLSHFDTRRVENLEDMFGKCFNMHAIDLSAFDTSSVTNMHELFYGCEGLNSLTLGENFRFVNGTDAQLTEVKNDDTYGGKWVRLDPLTGEPQISSACTAEQLMLTYDGSPDMVGTWVWMEAQPLTGPFAALRYADPDQDGKTTLSILNGTLDHGVLTREATSEAFAYDEVFYGYDEMQGFMIDHPYVLEWRTSFWFESIRKVVFLDEIATEYTYNWFDGCYKLEEIEGIEKLDTSGVSNMQGMFAACTSLSTVDLSHFRLDSLPNMNSLFAKSGVETLDLSGFDIRSIPTAEDMFYFCFDLSSITLGENFRFAGTDGKSAALPEAPQNVDYTGKWVRLDPVTGEPQNETACTAAWLMENYDGSADLVGTWVWQETDPVTGSFAVLRRNDPDRNNVCTFTFVNGSFHRGVLTRDATGEAYAYDELFFGGNDEYPGFLHATDPQWEGSDGIRQVQEVAFLDEITPDSVYAWFMDFNSVTSFEGFENLHTGLVENLGDMFCCCFSLETLDLTALDTTSARSLGGIFKDCRELKNLTLSPDFRFVDGIDATLTEPRCDFPYTGKWVHTVNGVQDHASACTAAELMTAYDGSAAMAGTWVWETYDRDGIFAVFSRGDTDDWTDDTFTFLIGSFTNDVLTRDGEEIAYDNIWYGGTDEAPEGFMCPGAAPWTAHACETDTVIFLDDFSPLSTEYWFGDFNELREIQGISHLHTGSVINMSVMFLCCSSLTGLDISGFDVSSCYYIKDMFSKCENLSELVLGENYRFFVDGDFDSVPNAELPDAPAVFPYTGKWVRIDSVTGQQDHTTARDAKGLMRDYDGSAAMVGTWVWETDEFDGIIAAFSRNDPDDPTDDTLTFLNGSFSNGVLTRDGEEIAFDSVWYGGTNEAPEGFMVGDIRWYDCNGETDSVIFLDDVAPKTTSFWFNGFSELTEVQGMSHLDTSRVNETICMFADCSSLPYLDLGSFDMTNVTDVKGMLDGCKSLSGLLISGDFRFFVGGDFDSVSNAGLPDARCDETYTGKWVRVDPVTGKLDHDSARDAKSLMRDYDGSTAMAGTWVWEYDDACSHLNAQWTETGREDSTCTADGWVAEALICGDCGETLDERCTALGALGHDFGEWTETTAPTCTEPGEETRYCSRCPETETRFVPAKGHTKGEWTEVSSTAAACVEAGSVTEEMRCTECGELLDTRTREVPALGHDWSAWETVREATFEEDGLERRTCGRCGETEERVIEWQGVESRKIQFVVSYPMHYVVHMRNVDYSIYSDTTPVIYWYDDHPLTFSVVIYSTWSVQGYVVSANGKEIKPDANGNYTIPAGTDRVQINCDPISTAATDGQDVCEYCGKIHPSTVWGFLIGMVHRLFAFFKNMGR